ncbi:MAG: mandelate racemase/muconate lactonizing enzyme family protein [Candidatus Latescibacterota bacterium]
MRITRIEHIVVCVPFRPGILPPPEQDVFSPAYPAPLGERRQDVLRLYTDAGLVGTGMSGPYFGDRDSDPPDLVGKDVRSLEPRALGGGGYSIALLDLIAQEAGWPLCRLFGGRLQERVLIDYWISRLEVGPSVAAARRAAELGFHGIKIKCRWEDGNVVERVQAMHEAAPELRIVVDPNERFHTLQNALQVARRLEGLDVLFEDPFPKGELTEYARFRQETSVPVAPHLQQPRQVVTAVELRAADAVNIGPSDWGFLDMARIAASEGLPVWQASNVDLGVFDLFRLHASAAAPNCTLGSDLCGNFVHEHSLLAAPLVTGGYAQVPGRPGLGVDLDEEAVARYALRRQTWP